MIDDHIGYIALNGFSRPGQRAVRARASPSSSTRAPTRSSSTCATTPVATSTRRSRSPASSSVTTADLHAGVGRRRRSRVRVHRRRRRDRSRHRPWSVLVNGGSASASEIVAAALQEHERATLIGEPSYGKNTVQVWGRLENDGGVRITISRWFTPGAQQRRARRHPARHRRGTDGRDAAGGGPGPRRGASTSWRATSRSPAGSADVGSTLVGCRLRWRSTLPAVVGIVGLRPDLLASPATKGGGVQVSSSKHATTEAVR